MRALTILILLAMPWLLQAQDSIVHIRKTIPSVTLQDATGNNFTSDKISNDGKPFIIVFWKTCCKPPIRELSTLSDVYDEWKEKTGVKIYAVAVDDSRSTMTVKPFAVGQGWEFEILLDPNQNLKRSMNVNVLPYTFIIDGKGIVVGEKMLFSEGDENEIFEMVQKANRQN